MLKYWTLLRHYIIVYGPYALIVWSAWSFYLAYKLKLKSDNSATNEDATYNKGACVVKTVWAIILLVGAIRLFFFY